MTLQSSSFRKLQSFIVWFSLFISLFAFGSFDTQSFRGLPTSDADGRIPTLNKMGWVIDKIDPFSEEFIKYSSSSKLPSLEIGAGYGFIVLEVLKKGGTIYANDSSAEHLNILKHNVPNDLAKRLFLMPGKFQDLKFEPNSLHAILAARILHFLDGPELKNAARLLHQWLAQGGKVFIVADTPYIKPWKKFLPVYLQRKSQGEEFPGLMANPYTYNEKRSANIPKFVHFLDMEVVTKVFADAGFVIEKAEYLDRRNVYPEEMCLDGKESIGLIARKS